MTPRSRFDCLWCGTTWTTRSPTDLEGWAQLCSACLGRAGENAFLRTRLRAALAARASATPAAEPPAGDASSPQRRPIQPPPRTPLPATVPAFPDDWFLRRADFARGPVHDAAWHAELDAVTGWLDGLGLGGRIREPFAGVGFWSPLLASHGELHAADPDAAALDRARDRLLAHRLRAHLHVEDPWHATDAPAYDAVVLAFGLGRVRAAGLDRAIGLAVAGLVPGGRLAIVDLVRDAAGGPPPGTRWTFHAPDELEAALGRAGLRGVEVRTTGRFFVIGSGRRPSP